MNNRQTILEAKNITLRRGGVTTLEIPQLSIIAGEVLSLVGPNGAGKSTLMLTLARLLKAHAGELLFRGRKIENHGSELAYRRSLAMVFQEPLLFETTVFNNVAAGLNLRGLARGEITRVVAQCLERFSIKHLADRSARKISGGEAQRTSLARAFALSPQIVFLDEPFSSLDPPTREALIEDLDRIIKETKTTVVFATHDQEEALRLSDRMAVMQRGRIIQIGPAADVINYPADEFVASFVGMETVLEGVVRESARGMMTVSIAGHDVAAIGEAQPGEKLLLGVRPENVTLAKTPRPEDTSARNVFPASVVKIIPRGLFYKICLDCGFFLSTYITGQSLESLALHEGTQVAASFKATAVHVIRKKS